MAAAKKAAKKKPAQKAATATTFTWKINDDGSFTLSPGVGIKNGDVIKIVITGNRDFDIKAKVTPGPSGGGGGPVIIHS